MNEKTMLRHLVQAVSEGRTPEAMDLTESLLQRNVSPAAILTAGLLDGMEDIGLKFRHNEVYVPQVVLAADAMQHCLAILHPLLGASDVKVTGRVLLATCQGDLHDLGKKIVGIMLEGAGFKVEDLGVDVNIDALIKAVEDLQPDIVGLAAGMSSTLPQVKWAVRVLKGKGFAHHVRLMVGGMPVTEGFARQIGADGYAADAYSAVAEARRLMGMAAGPACEGGEFLP
jgi:5-methyltetrahydrofolate--homocysteine methyltransferase